MRRSLVLGVFLLTALVASPLWAGAVYVPYAADITVGGVSYETQVWASNRGSAARRFFSVFIPGGGNGTDREGITPAAVGVPAGASVLATGVAPDDAFGMLEISGAPQLLISARLVPVGQGGGRLGGHLPVISSENLVAANDTVSLQGLARDATRVSDLLVVNIAQAAASCSVSNFLADGSTLGSTAQISLAPLTVNRYEDVLGILGRQVASGVRVAITCNQSFYAFALATDAGNGNVTVIEPGESLTSALIVPGTDDGGGTPGPCPDTSICFSLPGTVWIPQRGNSFLRETFALDNGEYTKARLKLDVQLGNWQQPIDGLHGMFWLAINRHFRLLGFLAARGPGSSSVRFRHGIDMSATEKPKFDVGATFIPGQTYKIDFLYDAINRNLDLKVFDSSGNVVVRITDRTNVGRIRIGNGEDLVLDLGGIEGANPNEPPPYGWQYRNVELEVGKPVS